MQNDDDWQIISRQLRNLVFFSFTNVQYNEFPFNIDFNQQLSFNKLMVFSAPNETQLIHIL